MHRLLFEKTGRAAYISHLDLMRTFQRAFMRAGIEIKHTEGFNPHAFISVALPLSVYQESVCELLDFGLMPGDISIERVPERLNACLPEGLRVLKAYEAQRPFKQIARLRCRIELVYDAGGAAERAPELEALFARESLVIMKKSKSGVKETDIRPAILSAVFAPEGERRVICGCVLSAKDPVLNPEALVTAISALLPAQTPDFYRIARLEVQDAGGKAFE